MACAHHMLFNKFLTIYTHTQHEQGGEMLAALLGFNRSTFFYGQKHVPHMDKPPRKHPNYKRPSP